MDHNWVEDIPHDEDGRKTYKCMRCGLEKDTWDDETVEYWLGINREIPNFMTCNEILMKEVME